MTQQLQRCPHDDAFRFPMEREGPFGLDDRYLHHDGRVERIRMLDERTAWLVVDHAHVRRVLRDPSFSADRRRPGFPTIYPGQQTGARARPTINILDGEEHTALRRSVMGEFTRARAKAMEADVDRVVGRYVNEILRSGDRPIDLVGALALPVASSVVSDLLGVPREDYDYFRARTSIFVRRAATQEDRAAAAGEIMTYFRDLIDRKKDAPADDLLGRRIAAQADPDEPVAPEDPEQTAVLAFSLLVAGYETTANMISLGTLALLRNREVWDDFRADAFDATALVEELLRYCSTANYTGRVAREDAEVGDVLVKAGDAVMIYWPTANHDPNVFDDPGQLDPTRGVRSHVAFGFGPHQCLGQHLARVELQTVFRHLADKMPELRLADPDEPLWFKDDTTTYGLEKLTVTW